MWSAIFNFILAAFRKTAEIFSGIPSKIAVLVAGLSAVVAECVTFIDSLAQFFSDKMAVLDVHFQQFAGIVSDSSLFSLFCYCLAFDDLVTILCDTLSFVVLVLTFVFVSFVHVVLIFFGLRYGYACYKYLVRSFSNGIAKA